VEAFLWQGLGQVHQELLQTLVRLRLPSNRQALQAGPCPALPARLGKQSSVE
jgi:hypothetical protein